MHYSVLAGARSPTSETMTPLKDGVTSDQLGNRDGMTQTDIDEMNAVYR